MTMQIRELANYHAILAALAAGKTGNSEIAAATHIGDRALPRSAGPTVRDGGCDGEL
jgi:hypothetical protein